ncbi:MAG: hypothetical protein MZV70_52540 [Desulfobacterales bacterium]|nr:hypothetical protein [Desulfobacterales bacterium]
MAADGICIFLLADGRRLPPEPTAAAPPKTPAASCRSPARTAPSHHAGEQRPLDHASTSCPPGCTDEIRLAEDERLQTLAYIPISSKEKQTFGVIRIGSRTPPAVLPSAWRNVLELIGNRIAAAIENATLQEQADQAPRKSTARSSTTTPTRSSSSARTPSRSSTPTRPPRLSTATPKAELVRLPFFVLGDEADAEVRDGLQQLEKGRPVLFSKKRHYKKGRRPFFVNINVSRAEYGGRDVLIATTTDITGIMEKEAQLDPGRQDDHPGRHGGRHGPRDQPAPERDPGLGGLHPEDARARPAHRRRRAEARGRGHHRAASSAPRR